jgi:hypothetical protein
LELEKTAKHGARLGVKIKKMWDSADGYAAVCRAAKGRRLTGNCKGSQASAQTQGRSNRATANARRYEARLKSSYMTATEFRYISLEHGQLTYDYAFDFSRN